MGKASFAVCIIAALGTLTFRAAPVLPQTIRGSHPPTEPICGSPVFSNPLVIEEAISNTSRLSPATYKLMLRHAVESVQKLVQDTIGTEHQFFVYNFSTKSFNIVTATLRKKGSLTEIWVDNAELTNGHIDDAVVDSIQSALENHTPAGSQDPNKGIVALEEQFLGTPPNSGESNGYVHFLITDINDGWDSTKSGSSFIAGFFQENDQPDPKTGVYASGSNKRDMLYIDSYPGIYCKGTSDPRAPLPTLAHELQHLIQWHYDPNETTFVNEGCSMNAEVLCGYPLRSPSAYFQKTDVPLFTWHGSTDDAVLADYSRAAIFTRYCCEQAGTDFLSKLIRSPLHGYDGITSALAGAGSRYNLPQIFRNWAIANMLNDTTAGREYGYSYPVSTRPIPSHTFSDPNICLARDTTAVMAVDYFRFDNGDSLMLDYSSSSINLNAIETGNATAIKALQASGTFFEPDFGSKYNDLVLVLVNNSGIGNGTLSLTSSGSLSSVRTELAYDDGLPDTLDDGATFLGFPDSSNGYGWAVDFTPPSSPYQLVGASIYAAFSQEFLGSTAPTDAPREFLFHVWSDNNGFPGDNLITPFLVKVNRSSFDNAFVDIDLTDYASSLSNLSGKIYIGFTENGVYSTSVGLNHPGMAGHSFAYFASTGKWRGMSGLKVSNSASLDGWDLMMRAVVAITAVNSPPPAISAGIIQDAQLSQYFNVVLTAACDLRTESICGTIALNGSMAQLAFSRVTPTYFVSTPLTLAANGTTAVTLKAASLLGTNYADTSFVFASAYVGSTGARLVSPDSGLVLTVPSQKVSFYATVNAGSIDSLVESATCVYALGPRGFSATRRIGISLPHASIDTSLYAPAIYYGSEYFSIPFTLTDGLLAASTTVLSTFAIVPRSVISGPLILTVPDRFALYQNYPNPFNPTTTIVFDLPTDGHVSLKVYDVLGREVATLVEQNYVKGSYPVVFDASRLSLPSGLYFCRIVTSGHTAVVKMMLVK